MQLDDLADLVVAAAVAAGAVQFPVVEMSLGAAVAVTAAVRHPEYVSALVITVGLAHADQQVRLAVNAWRALDATGDVAPLSALLLHAGASSTTLAAMTEAEQRAARAGIVATYPPGSTDHAELAARVDVTDLLPQVQVPTLAVLAGDDRLVLPSTARLFAEEIAGAESTTYDRAGHVFTPAENLQWADDVAGFLQRAG